MRSRSRSNSSSGRIRLLWNIEMVLLLVGLLGVFVLGIVMSSHVQLMDGRGMRGGGGSKVPKVTFEAQQMKGDVSHKSDVLLKDRIITNDVVLMDYMEGRKLLLDLIAEMRSERSSTDIGLIEEESLVSLLQRLQPLIRGISRELRQSSLSGSVVVTQRHKERSRKEEMEKGMQIDRIDQEASTSAAAKAEGRNKEKNLTSSSSREAAAAAAAGLPEWKQMLRSTALLIISHDRDQYLERCLAAVLRHHPGDALIPIIVSEDGKHTPMARVINKYQKAFQKQHPEVPFLHIHHQPTPHAENGYFALADHFKWALAQAFNSLPFQQRVEIDKVIILEEDLEIAPDFFNYFSSLAPLLESDHSLMAISAWNDNGMSNRVKDPKAVYRSDFFPGLGWMMPRRIWEELEPKWPKAYWDDWLREPKQRQGRQFLRPEVCRTLHFGQKGTSNMEFSTFLNRIKLNDEAVAFNELDLSYLEPDSYEAMFLAEIKAAQEIQPEALLKGEGQHQQQSVMKLVYDSIEGHNHGSFAEVARRMNVMDNIKAMVPRTAYKGVVTFWIGETKVHLVPKSLLQ